MHNTATKTVSVMREKDCRSCWLVFTFRAHDVHFFQPEKNNSYCESWWSMTEILFWSQLWCMKRRRDCASVLSLWVYVVSDCLIVGSSPGVIVMPCEWSLCRRAQALWFSSQLLMSRRTTKTTTSFQDHHDWSGTYCSKQKGVCFD